MKIDGRNVFCIYRPNDFPDGKIFIETWRELAKRESAPDFYFIGIADFPWRTPDHGYDGFTTNPPVGQLPYQGIKSINDEVENRVRAADPKLAEMPKLPQVYSYETFINNAFPQVTRTNEFFPCVMPNWDNTPRSGANGFVLEGSTPELYRRHLEEAIKLVSNNADDKRVVFIKSWNEWAEGNYLEPDMRLGHAYLETTFNTVSN
jgi:hypothetical protein